jgi:hypothetical protein
VINEVTAVTHHIVSQQDMSHWTRDHADHPGIPWSVQAGPGGTMVIVVHGQDRAAAAPSDQTVDTIAS